MAFNIAYSHMPNSDEDKAEMSSNSMKGENSMRHYFNFNGKANRFEFWVIIVSAIAILSINNATQDMWLTNGLAFIPLIFTVILAWLIISTGARRCRSAGLNPYLSALMVVPLIGFIAMLVLGIIKPKED